VLYITERCVFRLIETGLELIEIAPGVDLERDILSLMAFRPAISPQLKTMDARIFRDEPMGLRQDMLAPPPPPSLGAAQAAAHAAQPALVK
jgi:propionate CoA-transferase